ncbi:MAG: TRAP transporter large permease subunit [Deferribacteres bacterium]|nr:TRAP transporter large permease subunit [candidate division KSB1 bacterium]MCB9504158.1 TRAP transporter large permease subunit [Deferribacteres bacterium]
MLPEITYFIIMLVVFILAAMWWKLPIGISLILASIAGALASGDGIPIRHLVEGTFAYLDPILIIATAMIFMGALRRSGALGSISRLIIIKLHKQPFWLVIFITLFIMFPGMITGLSTATVLTTGALVAPALMMLGIPRVTVAAIIAMSAIYGMIAPPINIPAMIIGGGVDMPYIGFELPLLFATLPLAIGVNLSLGYKYLRKIDIENIQTKLGEDYVAKYGIRLFLPLIIVVVLMLGIRILPQYFPNLGVPLIFMIGSLVALICGEKFNFFKISHKAIQEALPVIGILVGIGMFIQIMTLNGVRGMLVISSLSTPSVWRYVSMGVMIPLFGAVSAYGSASVLGVPFLLAFLGQNEIIVGSALSLLTGLGDLMPPTALAGIFAAQVVGEENYFKVLRVTLIPAIATALWALAMIFFANQLGAFL